MKKYKLSIEGMHCASCASNIERSLKKVSGVKSVTVSAITNKAFAEIEDNVKEDELKHAVKRAGYVISKVEYE